MKKSNVLSEKKTYSLSHATGQFSLVYFYFYKTLVICSCFIYKRKQKQRKIVIKKKIKAKLTKNKRTIKLKVDVIEEFLRLYDVDIIFKNQLCKFLKWFWTTTVFVQKTFHCELNFLNLPISDNWKKKNEKKETKNKNMWLCDNVAVVTTYANFSNIDVVLLSTALFKSTISWKWN